MKRNKTIELITKHCVENFRLGIIYNSLKVKAAEFGMENLSKYMKMLSDDKLTIHKDLITDYLISVGNTLEIEVESKADAVIKSISTPEQLMNYVYESELKIRSEVNAIAASSIAESDFESFNFIQWFVKDGLKDFNEIEYIKNLFGLSNNLLQIDHDIKNILE